MKTKLLLSTLALSFSQGVMADSTFIPLSQACEEALALSALPLHLRSSANVYVLKDGKYSKTIRSAGGYNCLVERNHPKSLIPQCITPNGSKEILPTLMMRTELIYGGQSLEAVTALLKQKKQKGEIAQPKGHGINYMMSGYNRIFNNGNIRNFPAHVMFYAPGVENEDIGGSMSYAMKNKGFPFITQPSVHRYMVTMVEHASDSAQVEASCSGQI